jgi:hypothetical protein
MLQGDKTRDALSTLSVSVVLPDSNRVVVWEVRGALDNAFHFSQANIIPEMLMFTLGKDAVEKHMDGNSLKYRLMFQLNGNSASAAIDDISIQSGDCDIARSEGCHFGVD